MDIPTIDKTRGIFEIFIPGIFLFLNFVSFFYFFPGREESTKCDIMTLAANPILGSLILIAFGYLIGILLRLMKTTVPDRWSGILCWIYYDKCNSRTKKYYFEPFPYFSYIKSLCDKKLPPEAIAFYKEFWGKRRQARFTLTEWSLKNLSKKGLPDNLLKDLGNITNQEFKEEEEFLNAVEMRIGKEQTVKYKNLMLKHVRLQEEGNREFFNYCKVLINAFDERNANEIYSAEALSRYISGMLYALLFSVVFTLVNWIVLSFSRIFLILSLVYLVAIIVILLNFRFLRVKEVETVFTATLRNYYKEGFTPK